MAFLKLQPWHPCLGVRFLIPSAFRCLSSQPLQSPSKCWQVSSLGRVCDTRGVISRGMLKPSGYRMVGIAGQPWFLHRVVKLIYHGPPQDDEAWQVHHRDGNKENNALDNLEYVTPSQNITHSHSMLPRKDAFQPQSRPINWRMFGDKDREWKGCSSIASAAKQLGMNPTSVSRSCRNASVIEGYEFRFQDLEEPATEGEEWRPLLDPNSGREVAGRFISSLGRIKYPHGHVYRGCLDKHGYYVTKVRGQTMRVHRLVAFSFLGPAPSHVQSLINHKDLDKGNNRVENLEYVTPAENIAHFHANADIKRRGGLKPVLSRSRGSSDVWTWHDSMRSAARTLGVNVGNVQKCVSGQTNQSGGYEFQLVDSETCSLPGEIWREVNIAILLQDRERRKGCFQTNALAPVHCIGHIYSMHEIYGRSRCEDGKTNVQPEVHTMFPPWGGWFPFRPPEVYVYIIISCGGDGVYLKDDWQQLWDDMGLIGCVSKLML